MIFLPDSCENNPMNVMQASGLQMNVAQASCLQMNVAQASCLQ
jgi:hypothetical protein